MRKTFLVLAVVSVALLLVSCCDDECSVNPTKVYGSGVLQTDIRTHSPVHSVELRIPGDVILTYGSQQAVTVIADDNVLEYIETSVIDGVLRISNEEGVSIADFDLTVEVTLTDLQYVVCSAPGTIESTNEFDVTAVSIVMNSPSTINLSLDVDTLTTIMSGVGPITLTGTAGYHFIVFSGVGTVHSYDLSTATTRVVLSGEGDAEVRVSDVLDVLMTGIGTVYYKGTPSDIIAEITGSGSVVKIE